MTTNERLKAAKAIVKEETDKDRERRRMERAAHQEGEQRERAAFRQKIEASANLFQLTAMPQKMRDNLWDYAWDDGHSEGYERVEQVYDELVERFVDPVRELLK